jgi:hypothetical protein
VTFGTTAATSFIVNSATSITTTAPAGSTGTVDVTVTGPGGTSATSSADQYIYTVSATPTIAAVGIMAFKAGDDTTTLVVSPQQVGDLLVLTIKANSASVTLSSVSGGGASTWTRAEAYTGYSSHDLEIWTGTVSTTGASTVTMTFSASVTSVYTALASQEFSASTGTGTAWGMDTEAGISNASSATVTFPQAHAGRDRRTVLLLRRGGQQRISRDHVRLYLHDRIRR